MTNTGSSRRDVKESHQGEKKDRMKELRAVVSDEEFAKLKHLA